MGLMHPIYLRYLILLEGFGSPMIGGPTKMTFGTSNLWLFFLAGGYMIIKGVLDSTRPRLHNGLRKI
jgi:hypothetical protein